MKSQNLQKENFKPDSFNIDLEMEVEEQQEPMSFSEKELIASFIFPETFSRNLFLLGDNYV